VQRADPGKNWDARGGLLRNPVAQSYLAAENGVSQIDEAEYKKCLEGIFH
jgi:hypothetical protein